MAIHQLWSGLHKIVAHGRSFLGVGFPTLASRQQDQGFSVLTDDHFIDALETNALGIRTA
jgi:hypothetical protein